MISEISEICAFISLLAGLTGITLLLFRSTLAVIFMLSSLAWFGLSWLAHWTIG